MKKLLAIAISLSLVCSFSTGALAENTTVLTTTVPDATYTLNIPANQEIPFGTTEKDIGAVTVTNGSGFAVGKDLEVTVNFDAFTCEGVSTTIPFGLRLWYGKVSASWKDLASGDSFVFKGQSDGTTKEEAFIESVAGLYGPVERYAETMLFQAGSEDWGKALAGEYSSTITFTAEVVVSEP